MLACIHTYIIAVVAAAATASATAGNGNGGGSAALQQHCSLVYLLLFCFDTF